MADLKYFLPGALFLLSTWYTKKELAFRTAFLYSGSLLSGAFSGFISAGIQGGLDGALGHESWRWLFWIEGAITGVVAIVSIFVLPDYPATTKRLSLRERAMAVYRLELDAGEKDEDTMSLWQSFKLAATDYRLYLLALIIITKTTAGAVTQFFPSVVQTFGFNKVLTLVLTAPPYLFTTFLSLAISWSSDRRSERCLHLAIPLAVGMIGFVIAAATTKTGPRYFSLFLMLGGLFGSYNIGELFLVRVLRAKGGGRCANLVLPVLSARLDLVLLPPPSRQARLSLCHHQLARQHRSDLVPLLVPEGRRAQVHQGLRDQLDHDRCVHLGLLRPAVVPCAEQRPDGQGGGPDARGLVREGRCRHRRAEEDSLCALSGRIDGLGCGSVSVVS